jgi:hypothetical protein
LLQSPWRWDETRIRQPGLQLERAFAEFAKAGKRDPSASVRQFPPFVLRVNSRPWRPWLEEPFPPASGR